MIDNYITGASGFIGSRLVASLKGETVCIPHAHIYYTKLQPFRRFFFLSAYGNMHHHKDKYAMLQANLLDPVSVLQQIRVTGCESFVYVSTSSVNLQWQTPYSLTKAAAEGALQAFMGDLLPIAIARPFTVIGVGEQREHLIPTLIRSCFEGEEMWLDPNPVHDFIDVQDVVDGLIHIADSKMAGVFNLGTGVSTTNHEIREMVEQNTKKKAKAMLGTPIRLYDTLNWKCEGGTPEGWKPKKTLQKSIREMVEHYESAAKTLPGNIVPA